MLSPLKGRVTRPVASEHAHWPCFSTLRHNFYDSPCVSQPREVMFQRAASLDERCTALDTSYS